MVMAILRRVAVPLFVLFLFSGLAFLWTSGLHANYVTILTTVGITPFREFPFLDLHAILAAAQCHRAGVDVFITDPCDIYNRPHVYSPLWLDIVPPSVGIAAVPWLGVILDLTFILSLVSVFRPRDLVEIAICAAASCSTMVIYAIERANNDLIIFLLILLACALFQRAFAARLTAYALILFAGLLKYYPLVLLGLIMRESWRRACWLIGSCSLVLGFFLWWYGSTISLALSLVPKYSTYFAMDGFSAQFLPFGVTRLCGWEPGNPMISIVLLALFSSAAVLNAIWFARLIDVDWSTHEIAPLFASAVLLVGCFFAGQNVNYRGIFFLPIIAGLLSLRRSSGHMATRCWLFWLLAAILFLMWDEFFRQSIEQAAHAITSNGQIIQKLEIISWFGRELVWWWVIASLGAVIVAGARTLPSEFLDIRRRFFARP